MLLTKKSIWKIVITAVCYAVLGTVCMVLWFVFNRIGVNEHFMLILGLITYLFGGLMVLLGRFAEGKGKLLNAGNKRVRQELKPAAFLEEYEALKQSTDLVVCKPDYEILLLVVMAHDALDNRERALATLDEMIAVTDGKKKETARLMKAGALYSYNRVDEAEALFQEVQSRKLDAMNERLADVVLKSDRAMAMGDYSTAQAYYLKRLEQTFPKPDNLYLVTIHYHLGEIYEKWQDSKNAMTHYQYCVDHGGETAIQTDAAQRLQRLK